MGLTYNDVPELSTPKLGLPLSDLTYYGDPSQTVPQIDAGFKHDLVISGKQGNQEVIQSSKLPCFAGLVKNEKDTGQGT